MAPGYGGSTAPDDPTGLQADGGTTMGVVVICENNIIQNKYIILNKVQLSSMENLRILSHK